MKPCISGFFVDRLGIVLDASMNTVKHSHATHPFIESYKIRVLFCFHLVQVVEVAAPHVSRVLDTTGAGDAFLGGMIVGLKNSGMPQTQEDLRYSYLLHGRIS